MLRPSSRDHFAQETISYECRPMMDTKQHLPMANLGSATSPTPAVQRETDSGVEGTRKATRPSSRSRRSRKPVPATQPSSAQSGPSSQLFSASAVAPAKRTPKRKTAQCPGSEDRELCTPGPAEIPGTSENTNASPSKRPRRVHAIVKYHGKERRPRPWRDCPPDTYLDRVDRINKTRMFIVGQRVREKDGIPEFLFDVVGSTGNIYQVKIGQVPSCDCPDAKFRGRGECKHIVYVLLKALNARPELRYQISFVSSELSEMYEGSLMSLFEESNAADHDHDGRRKPLEGACPICFLDFAPKDKTVWCQTGCGNNVHKVCFEQWARTSLASQGCVRCIYCRTDWHSSSSNPNVDNIRKTGTVGPEGYVNVAEQFGLPTKRDSSVYSSSSTVRQSRSSGHLDADVDCAAG